MRRRMLTGTAVLATLCLALNACSGTEVPTTKETIDLRFGDYLTSGHPTRDAWSEPFIEELEKRADDTIDINVDYIGGGELVGATSTYDALQDGVIDMGSLVSNYISDYLPIAGIAEVPGALQDDSIQGSAALIKFLRNHAMGEFADQNMRPVMAYAVDPYNLVTSDTELEHPSDLNGLIVRGGGGALNDSIQALGASPVQMSVADTYMSLDRGVIDGSALGGVSIASYDLFDVAGYATRNLKVGSASLIYAVNDDWWQSLSPKAQRIVEEAAAAVQRSAPPEVYDVEQKSYEEAADAGMTVYDVPNPGEWESAYQHIADEWATRMTESGKDGEALMAAWRGYLDDAAQS
ncbi:TRAP transporter substrate-binding protein [Prauserella cavernicola]|uniref:TRAP transporter substrate-binding protein DctP n=1 Tax=Prauserella cavernicola TaxID=2800127 RepID=A0A934V8A2_9PSEU|nr:TRAP transporter substrate-binding protein DctP [Prauserella cavernicola]MBK1789447.1 TRAP transporter substrate-binding protein DctP [Prauserella cavernicola]